MRLRKNLFSLLKTSAIVKHFTLGKTSQYLKMLAKKYLDIYQNRKEKKNRILIFFKYRLPLIIAKHHRVLLIAFCLFILFVTIGFFSAKNDPDFVRQILGDGYVDMTEKNIKDGHPFGVYGYGNEFLSFILYFHQQHVCIAARVWRRYFAWLHNYYRS